MYSGMYFSSRTGKFLGAHQKIDRIARRQLEQLHPGIKFPSINEILQFEGFGGPDGIKLKSPAKNEPWHYIDPDNIKDNQLIEQIKYHYNELVIALKTGNHVRAAFEAAWLAHALVDGLTPAHHYPYEEKLKELGAAPEVRSSIKDKLLLRGKTRTEVVSNNWKFWGPKGLLMTHALFEYGFAILIAPLSFASKLHPGKLIERFNKESINDWYRELVKNVAKLKIYDEYYRRGWSIKNSKKAKNNLAPLLIDAVTTVWFCAYDEAKFKS